MSHYFAAVLVPLGLSRDDAEKHVEAAMAPYQEEVSDTGAEFWDWWQIGGRWTGVWSDYDPQQDPANVETCFLCQGTGTRPDAARFGAEWLDAMKGCNGCMGEGVAPKWPTAWAPYDGDIIPVSALLARADWQRPYTLLGLDVGPLHREVWDGNDWQDTEYFDAQVDAILARFESAALVVVDYHS